MKKLLLTIAALLGFSSLSLGQGVRYPNQVLTPGVGFPNPTIRVCVEPATGTPCTPLASIFSDAALTNPLANPFSGDANGNFYFYANPSSTYHVQISGNGLTTSDIPDITLPGGGTVIGGGTTVLVNASPVPAPSANFNSSQPAIPANNIAVTFQKDANGVVTGVSGYVPYASPTQIGVVQLANDLGGVATLPTVIQTHLTNPLPIAQGGCNSTARAGCFNNIAPSTQAGGLIVGTGPDTYGNLPAPSVGTTCLTDTTGTIAWLTCGGGTITGGGTANTLTKFTAATVVGNSGILDNGTLVSTAENVQITGALGIGATSVPGSSSSLPANGTTISSQADIESVVTVAGGATPVRNNLVLSQDLNFSTNWQTSDSALKVWEQTDALNASNLTGGGFMRGGIFTTTHAGTGSVPVRSLVAQAFNLGAGTIPENDAFVAIAQETGPGPITANNAILAQSGLLSGNGNIATDATVNIASPAIAGSGVMTTHYGLFIADQSLGGAKNPQGYSIFSAGGKMFHSGVVGIGAASVPGACGATASCTSVLDVEQAATGSLVQTNSTTFQNLDINLAANSTGNFSAGTYSTIVNDANTKDFNGIFGSGPKGLAVRLGVGGSGNFSGLGIGRGLEVQSGTNPSFSGTINTLTGIYAPIFTQGAGTVSTARGVWVSTVPQAGTIQIDQGLYFGGVGVTSGSTATVAHHYAIYMEDQSVGGGGVTNSDGWGIFQVNPSEKNQLGALSFQGAMVAATTASVNMAAASHTLPVFVGTIAQIVAKSGTIGELAFATDATAGQNLYYCPATATPCLWVQQLNSGGVGAMSTSASNAAITAVPADWRPSGTGNVNLGDAAHPWGSLFLGNAATNNIQLTGTATSAKVATLPDNTGTIAELNLSQTWTATQTFAAILASSVSSTTANPAAAGFGRIANTDVINIRNGTNAGDITALSADANNFVYLGQSGAAGVRFPTNINSLTSGLALSIQPTANTGNGIGGALTLSGGAGAGTGANGDVILTGGSGGSGSIAVIQMLSAQTYPLVNNSPTGTVINRLASYDASGRAIITPAGSTNGLAGVCAENCGITGTALFARLGKFNVNLDNTGTPGHYVGISVTTAGFGTDCGVSPCGTQLVGTVIAAVSGTVYTVDLSVGGGASGNTAANVIISNPVASQTIQGTAPTVVSLTTQCPTSAASTLDCFAVNDNTGAPIFHARQDGSVIWGSGTAGTITAQALISNTVPAATIGEVRLGNTDSGMCWRNNANNGNVCFSKDSQDVVHLSGVLDVSAFTASSNSLTLTESTAPAGVALKDILYADSTFHGLMRNDNNTGVRRVASTNKLRTVAGTTDTITSTQNEFTSIYTNGGAVTVTVNQSTGQILDNFCFWTNVTGAGTVTLQPTTSTINGGATLALTTGKSAYTCADGAGNYQAISFISTAAGGDMSTTGTNTMGAAGKINMAASTVTDGFRLPSGAGANPTTAAVTAFDTTTNMQVWGNGTSTVNASFGVINNQTGTTYTVLTGDRNKAMTFSNAGAIAITQPNAGANFPNGWCAFFENRGVGAATITPTTATVDGALSVTLATNQGTTLCSDGTNYFTFNRGISTGLNDPGGNGFVDRTSANTTAARTLTGTVNQINISNGGGGGNPVFSLDTTHVATDTNALTFTNKNISGATNTLTNIAGASLNANSVTSTQMAVVNNRRQCDLVIGDTSGSVVTNAQLGPQKHVCKVPYAATVVEVDIEADAGTPNVIVGRRRCTTFGGGACTVETGANLLSSALATNASGLGACSNTGGTTGIDGGTTCAATLQNTGLNAGDWIELVSGTAGGTAKLVSAHVIYTVN